MERISGGRVRRKEKRIKVWIEGELEGRERVDMNERGREGETNKREELMEG